MDISKEELALIDAAQVKLDSFVLQLGQLRSSYVSSEKTLLSRLNDAEEERAVIIRSIGRRLKLDDNQNWAWDPMTKTFVIPGDT